MPVIYSITQLKQMLDAFWFDNTNRSINGTDPNVWLKKMLDSCCGAKKIITGITAVATASVNISALKTGDVLGGKTLSTGDMIFLPAQVDASENGLYIVGENAGETERHLDFADAASCDGYFLVLASPQAGVGPYFLVNTDSGDGISLSDNTQIPASRNPISGYVAREITDSAIDVEFTIDVDSPRVVNRGITGGGNLIYNFAEVGSDPDQFANGWDICILNPVVSTGNIICKNQSGTVVYVLTPGMALHGIADSNITTNWTGYYIRSQSLHYYSPDVSYAADHDNIIYLNGATLEFYHIITDTNAGETPVSHAAKFSKIGGSSGGGSTNFAQHLCVDPNGNDGTAVKGDLTKPYLTIEAAVAAAIAGDVIDVMMGSYTIISNLAKNGVTFNFWGSIVTKTTSGAIFDFTNPAVYTSDIKILGYGCFYKTTTTGEVFTINGNSQPTSSYIFQFDKCSATHSRAINLQQVYGVNVFKNGTIKGNYCASSGNDAICVGMYTGVSWYPLSLEVVYINSTAGAGINFFGAQNTNVVCSEINSTTTYGVTGDFGACSFNIGYCKSFNLSNSAAGLSNSIRGRCGAIINAGASTLVFNGECNVLTNTGNIIGGNFGNITQTAGYSNIIMNTPNYNWSAVTPFNISGGSSVLNGNFYYYAGAPTCFISGTAKVILNANILIQPDYTNSDTYLTISGGIIEIRGKFNILSVINPLSSMKKIISKTGGVLILNGASFVKADQSTQFINCETSAQNICIYSGGVNTNGASGDLLSAKAKKRRFQVTAVTQPTTVVLAGTTITSTVNTSKANIAADMVSLINAAAIGVTASQDSAGVDEYFYAEADVAGTPFTESGLVNLTGYTTRLNSYAITNSTPGAVIIEDSDVTY